MPNSVIFGFHLVLIQVDRPTKKIDLRFYVQRDSGARFLQASPTPYKLEGQVIGSCNCNEDAFVWLPNSAAAPSSFLAVRFTLHHASCDPGFKERARLAGGLISLRATSIIKPNT